MRSTVGTIFGLQLLNAGPGEDLSSGPVWITATEKEVANRVAEMQSHLRPGNEPLLTACFQVRVMDIGLLELVHYLMTLSGRHLRTDATSRWYRVSPETAERMVRMLAQKEGVLLGPQTIEPRFGVQPRGWG